MFTHVDHIGLAVKDLDEAVAFYTQAFGVMEWERLLMPEQHMAVAVARLGDSLVELIAPTSDQASFAKFLRERGPGMHHIAYRVDDIAAALATLRTQNIPLIDETPRPGLHNTLVAFIHPKGALGVLVELVEHTRD